MFDQVFHLAVSLLRIARHGLLLPGPWFLAILQFAVPAAFAAAPSEPARAIEQAIAESGRSLPELIQPIALSRTAEGGLTFEEVVESVRLRANKLNLTPAGSNFLPRGQDDGRVAQSGLRAAILSYCDPELAMEMLAIVPEFSVFLPCRIAIVRESNGAIRVMTIDWRAEWFKAVKTGPQVPPALLERLNRLLLKLADVVESGAKGDL